MAFRTNSTAVAAILGDNYGPDLTGVSPDLTVHIQTANVVVNQVVTMAAQKAFLGGLTLGADMLERIECYLAAHFYAVADPLYTSRSTQGASGQFQVGPSDEGFGATEYGRQAMAIDYSGCLKQMSKKLRATATWLGKPPSQQIPYCERD